MSEQMLPERTRSRRVNMTDRQVQALQRKRKRYVKADPELRGHYLRVPPSGPITFAAVARTPLGKQTWATIGTTAELTIDLARERAREAIRRIKDGLTAFEPVPVKADSYQAIAEKWLELHVAEKGLRSAPEIERLLRKFVFPVWAERDFVSIRRKDINDLLDSIVKDSGPWNADHCLAVVRTISNWHAARSDDYASPFVAGMRRTKSEDRERSRTLSDDELRKVWRQAEANGAFGAFVRILLLTAQRRGAVVGMKFADIKDGVWEVATTAREKGNFGAAKLPEAALAIIEAQPCFKGNPYVFAAPHGPGALSGFDARKVAFDTACGVTDWTLHDLRRTARSLMSRAGITDEHAEHALGHKLQGVRKVYNRHSFFTEKSAALAKLATLIEHIVHPVANVLPMVRPEAADARP